MGRLTSVGYRIYVRLSLERSHVRIALLVFEPMNQWSISDESRIYCECVGAPLVGCRVR